MSLAEVYFWVQKLAALALILQNLEHMHLLLQRRQWPWAIVRKDFLDFPKPFRLFLIVSSFVRSAKMMLTPGVKVTGRKLGLLLRIDLSTFTSPF